MKKKEVYSLDARMKGDRLEIEALFEIPKAVKKEPQRSIRTLEITLNGKTIFETEFGLSLSNGTRIGFSLRGAKLGDKLTAKFTDDQKQEHSVETAVSA